MAELTLVVGPQLGGLAKHLSEELGVPGGCVNAGSADVYTRALVSCFMRIGIRGGGVVWLPSPSPALDAHQRRSLERIAQGLRPAVLFEANVGLEEWTSGSWVMTPALGASRAVGAAQLQPSPAPSRSSKAPAPFTEHLGLARLRPVNPGPGTGSGRPGGVLLVGDRPNVRSWGTGALDEAVSWPFISQLGTGCSAWLSHQLEASGVPERRMYWVNAYRADGTPSCDLAELRDRLDPLLIVALGKEAASRLEECGVRFAQVHHPQYWKRFGRGNPYQLVKVLARYQRSRS